MKGFNQALLPLIVLLLMSGCDAATRYKVLSTVFDGVPDLPPVEEYCAGFCGEGTSATVAPASAKQGGGDSPASTRSSHEPYTEKLCNDCHSEDKNSNDGLVVPRQELCYECHEAFEGTFRHGPAAVGDCTACHSPHSSPYESLLVAPRSELCGRCHQEKRLAAEMHAGFEEKNITCDQCHDPHAGNARYFLR